MLSSWCKNSNYFAHVHYVLVVVAAAAAAVVVVAEAAAVQGVPKE
jgi:flagellar motor component MotA